MKRISTLIFLIASLQLNAQWETYNTGNVSELKSNNINSIVVSPADNNIWFGTDNGLTRYNGSVWVTYTAESDNIASNTVNDISYKNTNYGPELLLSTGNGATVLNFTVDGISTATPYRTDNSGIISNKVYSNGISSGENKFFGTEKGVSMFVNSNWVHVTGFDSTYLANSPVKSIKASSDGYTYLGSRGNGIYQYQDDVDGVSLVTVFEIPWSNIPSDTIFSLFVDSNGSQWYGTNNGVKLHSSLKAKEGWDSIYYTTQEGLPNDTVTAIIQDVKGNMWFGTNNGLALRQGENWTIFTTADGLASNRIHDIAQDMNSNIWIATDKGISKYIPSWAGIPVKSATPSFSLNIHPNPARDGVWVKYNLPTGGPTRVAVFDLAGRMIKQLQYGFNEAGEHEIFWNTAGDNGSFADAGIYVVRIQSNNLSTTKKMVILR